MNKRAIVLAAFVLSATAAVAGSPPDERSLSGQIVLPSNRVFYDTAQTVPRIIFPTGPQSIQIWGTNRPGRTEPLVSISLADGSVKFGADYTADKAARTFWEAMGRSYCPVAAAKP